ncbi:MAG: DUF4114 domain-containing protein [Kastovskya adunca ATA6-11-RM4]|jgi:hypothetical protein|nr:DUF4114 domain-containing protein [Kastovskya adunca ATA6-11-RM4]
MRTKLFTSLLAAATTLTGVLSANTAFAFTWNNSWTQPTVYSKSQTGFDDTFFQQFVQKEKMELANAGQFLLDPENLKLKYSYNVSVFFINEGAANRNQLAYEATGQTTSSGLIFKDISSPESLLPNPGGPLKKGDSVNLGKITAGTQLDFFLRSDGFSLGNKANIFGTQTSSNPDSLQHVVAYAIQNSRYLLLGFEDLYGSYRAIGGKNQYSDRDFNDAVFAVDIGEKNVKHLTAVPEPSTTAALAGLAAVSVAGLRRRNRKQG